MTLKELIRIQQEFDERHSGKLRWDASISDDNIDMLQFLVLCLGGEVGELANIVKNRSW